METETLHKISPSTSVATFSSHVTPKRSLTPQCPGTPLQFIKKESNEKEDKCTPLRRNPFDVKAEALYLPACSPSVFATFQRNKVNDGTFRWSIEHLSVLYPADIDETSIPETWVDAEHEMKAQKAIDTFFSQNSIVPSPWSSSPKEGKCGFRARRRARTSGLFSDGQSCEATTQTMLSIPPNVDLEKILGKYFTFDDNEESYSSQESSREETDILSNSSLRRKLFATDENFSSPSRVENKHPYSAKRQSTPSVHMRSVQSTPASDLLSSSPITPPNCSDSCNMLSSPTLSPIAAAPIRGIQFNDFTEQHQTEHACKTAGNQQCDMGNVTESGMSFCIESQEINPFPSYTSDKQDTGYGSGSISSFQNITSEVQYGLLSRITPVTELIEECELSNSMSCDMSYRNDMKSTEMPPEIIKSSQLRPCDFKTYPWVPTCCSTPAQCSHL